MKRIIKAIRKPIPERMRQKLEWVLNIFCLIVMVAVSVMFGLVGYLRPPPEAKAYFIIVFIAGFCGGVAYLLLFYLAEQAVKAIRNKCKKDKA